MSNLAENVVCPFCGAPAADLTCHGDDGKRWLCIGRDAHEWREGDDIPEPPDDDSSVIVIE